MLNKDFVQTRWTSKYEPCNNKPTIQGLGKQEKEPAFGQRNPRTETQKENKKSLQRDTIFLHSYQS